VDQGQLGLEPLVRQVREERLELSGGQHPLVDQGAGRQRREVDPELSFGPLAQAERHADPGRSRDRAVGGLDEDLAKCGMTGAGGGPDQVGR
jgi:hypothetical protein